MTLRMTLSLILLTLFLIISIQNTEAATFNILFWTVDLSRIVFMYIAVLVGFIAGYLTSKLYGIKKEMTDNTHASSS